MSDTAKKPDGRVNNGRPVGAVNMENREFRDLCRKFSPAALNRIVALVGLDADGKLNTPSEDIRHSDMIRACEVIIERAHGKPVATHVTQDEDGNTKAMGGISIQFVKADGSFRTIEGDRLSGGNDPHTRKPAALPLPGKR